jgi:hypothetical protein
MHNTFTEAQMLDLWRAQKVERGGFYRLQVPVTVEHEFNALKRGHPSTYAFVRFECAPASELRFTPAAVWPDYISPKEADALHRGIVEGIVDGLVHEIYPHRGVSVRLVECRYDESDSSVWAFHRATVFAMQTLLKSAWTSTP